jgi:hypothetical protein
MSSNTFTNSIEVSGVSAAGFSTMVQPAAIAGAILRVAMASGKFQGVMKREGPTGRFRTMMRFLPSGAVPYLPVTRTASSENQRKKLSPVGYFSLGFRYWLTHL